MTINNKSVKFLNNNSRHNTGPSMLSQSKQNIYSLDKPLGSQSTRRNSTHSTSACKKILKSICEDSEITDRNFQSIHLQPDTTIREIKLKQTINILQKKNNKQTQQIIMLTQDLNTLAKLRQDQLKNLEIEMDKIRKAQVEKNQSNKTIADLKKKVCELQSSNQALKAKYTDLEKKFIKMKDLLRKKEMSLAEINSKLEENSNIEEMMAKQKQQTISLRSNFLQLKQKQDSLEEENQLYKAKLSQCKKQTFELKSQIYIIQQQNKRLEEQCEELQLHYEQSEKQASAVQKQMTNTIQLQNKEISRLREMVQKIQNIENDTRDSGGLCDVYKEEIAQLVRTNVADKGARARVEKGLAQIIDNMEESMNRILMQIVAAHL